MFILRQSTAKDIKLGPFVDKGDGVAYETGMAAAMDHADTGVRLSKNGAAFADRNEGTEPSYDAFGYYLVKLDTTDTNTVGTLKVIFGDAAVCLPCEANFQVVEEAVYDALYVAAAPGYGAAQSADNNTILAHADYGLAKLVRSTTPANALDVSATGEAGLDFDNIKDATGAHTLTNITVPTVTTTGTCTTNTDMRGTDNAALASVLGAAVGASISADVAGVKSDTGAILTDTGTTLENHITDIKGTGFAKDTHSLPQCLTATGFSTHSAADAATAVLAADPTTAVVGATPNTLAKFIQGLWNRGFKKRTATADTETAYETDGATTMETWTLADDDTTASRTP